MSSIRSIRSAIFQDENATIISPINEKQNASVPTILPDEVVYASDSKVETDHEYLPRHLTFHYIFIFVYIPELKCNDPENGVNKQTSTVDSDLDGGYGWLVILGTFMVQVTSFGTASCCVLSVPW
ncbi:hypothetical protein [Parasitella parasitica]|uniref:Uncharacterized protein n=1 Tax=Parasitella parasitica TaxID=35722 RepID=A0A0B7MX89_9FUNG|nr:hypothetical protein [Parasitella parasitica]